MTASHGTVQASTCRRVGQVTLVMTDGSGAGGG